MANKDGQIPKNREVKKRRLENTETNQENANNKAELTEKTHLEKIQELMVNNQLKQEKFNKEALENQRLTEKNFKKLSEEIQSIRAKLNKNEEKSSSESSDVENSGNLSKLSGKIAPATAIPASGKSFIMKHVFKKVGTMKPDEDIHSDAEEHFGLTWKLCVMAKHHLLVFYLICEKSLEDGKWSIETKIDLKFVSKSGKHVIMEMNRTLGNDNEKDTIVVHDERNYEFVLLGATKFIENGKVNEDFVTDGQLHWEIYVKIHKMTGIYTENLRYFDDSMKEFSDVVMVVQYQKFFVSKLILASHSSYFQSMFLGNFQESKKSEINLSGIGADDFQKYLEVIYGENAIDETTVEGILLVSDMYDTPIVIRKCEEFLLEKSKKSLKKKLKMAAKYDLEQLKSKCMSEIKTIADIKSILPENIDDLDHSMMAELFKKFLELQ